MNDGVQINATAPLLIAGPTAVGKSAVALALAQRLRGEIISVDSMQVYRGLDIGTAKPSKEERDLVPHHLIDIVDLSETYDAAKFVVHAEAALAAISQRGRVPILCGGTGLYFKALLQGLGEAPPPDPALRREIEQTSREVLLRELEQHDPALFARIDRQNPRRLIRAIEVLRLSGKPYSEQRASWHNMAGVPGQFRSEFFFGVKRAPEDLRRRIDDRVDRMFERGIVAETARLLAAGLEQNRTAFQSIGYRQVVEHLRGERSLSETIELVKQRTRQFAKRQTTWFRRQANLSWIELPADADPEAVAEELAILYERTRSD